MALGTDGSIWSFSSWGRPCRLISPLLDCTSPDTTPIDITCGLNFDGVLTMTGVVYTWHEATWRRGPGVEQPVYASIKAGMEVIQCVPWDLQCDPARRPDLPADLPNLGDDNIGATQIIKIAAMTDEVVALTNKGHVLILRSMTSPWKYVSYVRIVQDHRNSDSFLAS